MILSSVLRLGILPFAAFFVAQWLFGSANLVGAYLLVSPIIAVMVLFGSTGLKWAFKREKNTSDPDPDLTKKACRFAVELGMNQAKVYIQPEDDEDSRVFINMMKDDLYVMLAPWKELSEDEQEFGLAQKMAYSDEDRKRRETYSWIHDLVLFVGCLIATQSLWAILVMHTVGLVGGVLVAIRTLERNIIKADRRAIAITRDLFAAQKFIRTTEGKYKWPIPDIDERITALYSYSIEQ